MRESDGKMAGLIGRHNLEAPDGRHAGGYVPDAQGLGAHQRVEGQGQAQLHPAAGGVEVPAVGAGFLPGGTGDVDADHVLLRPGVADLYRGAHADGDLHALAGPPGGARRPSGAHFQAGAGRAGGSGRGRGRLRVDTGQPNDNAVFRTDRNGVEKGVVLIDLGSVP